MMAFFSSGGEAAVMLLFLLLAVRAPPAESVRCHPLHLLPCFGAIFYSRPPSSKCCAQLREQQPCFCQYKRDPILMSYANSRNGRRVASTCGVPNTRC
ncbi:unnamed protein product [Spirodela intermedia]|uniref:Bifunctional inhibitor/plant lipid transfer protein/seed storage helical domain-containing protein n=1 Tax=Spirodela intermedia TaxID=51605 RepID=A0A7I8IVY0_SPIIN|nr:unnamed protein product [Spirodela intermedia]CAA6661309.1 unnamed protein product [Spirodela intermedia]